MDELSTSKMKGGTKRRLYFLGLEDERTKINFLKVLQSNTFKILLASGLSTKLCMQTI
jgi:hypothetical protein